MNSHHNVIFKRRIGVALLAYFSCIGNVIGIFLAQCNKELFSSALLDAIDSGMLLFGRFLSLSLPILLISVLLSLFGAALIYPVCFLKSISYAACCYGFYCACGNTGWLMILLLLIPDTISVLCLYWFAIRNIPAASETGGRDLLVSLTTVFIFCLLEWKLALPILSSL